MAQHTHPPDVAPPVPEKLPFFPKNKKFLIPIIILLSVTLVGLVVGVLVAFTALQHTEPYKATMQVLSTSPEAALVLGEPIEPGLITMGKVDEQAGVADLMFKVTGPNDRAAVRSRCELIDGVWQVTYLDLGLGSREDGEVITLIGDAEQLPQ